MYTLSIWSKIGDATQSFFVGILLTLDGFIYSLISSSYKIFMALASARLLSSENFTEIANKIYLIIGVAMLFVLAYAILQGIIDPDKMSKGDMGGGKMVRSIIIAVFGLALAPVLFNIIYQAQGLILENNVLNKIFFRTTNGEVDAPNLIYKYKVKDEQTQEEKDESLTVSLGKFDYNEQIKDIGGAYTATSIWSAFFYPTNIDMSSDKELTKRCMEEYKNNDGRYTDDDSQECKTINPRAIWTDDYIWLGSQILHGAICAGLVGGLAFALGIVSAGIGTVLVGAAGAALCVAADNMQNAENLAYDGHKITLQEAYTYTGQGGNFDIYQTFIPNYTEDDEAEKNGAITYVWGLSTIAGIFALYCFVSFSIDMGVRAAKLAYYQIIAPVPIIMQIVPKFRNMFQDFIKNVFNTFLEVFIRIMVVYIVTYVLCHIPDLFSSTTSVWQSDSLNIAEKAFAQVFLIIGILIFAKQAPKLIGETLGIKGGNLNLGIGKKLAEGGVFAAGATLGSMATAGVRNFRSGVEQPGKFTQRIGRGLRSAIGGAGSAGARSIRSQFIGPDHKQAMTFKDMKAQAGQSAQAATDARDRRTQTYKEEASQGRTGLSAFAHHHKENIGDRINAWSTGTFDTSYMDGHAAFLSNARGLEGKLEDTVKNDAIVKDAQRRSDMLNNADIGDIAYTQALNTRATSQAEAIKAANLKAMSDANKRARWLAEGMAASAYTAAAFDAAVDSGQIKDAVTEADIRYEADKLSNSATGSFKRSDYTVDINSQEYRDAQGILSQRMKDAATDLKKAKEEAVQRKLAEAATGIENDTSRALKEFFNENQKDIRTYANEELYNDGTRSISIGEYLGSNFGASSIVNGTVDLGQTLGSQNNVISYKIEGNNGYSGDVTITNNGSGQATYEIREASGATKSFNTMNAYQSYIQSQGVTKTKDSTLTGDRKAVTSDLKTRATSARDALVNGEEFKNAQARKRAAQERK